MGHPLVSVVIPCYNQSRWVGDAIGSVARSDYPRYETIVVNDGSTDDFRGEIARHPHVKVLDQANGGVSAARNAGFATSRGTYVVFLDADDRIARGWLSEAVACLEDDPRAGFVYGQVRIIDATGAPRDVPRQEVVAHRHYEELLRRNYIWSPGCVLYRRSALEVAGLFDTARSEAADLEINLRVLRRFPARGLARVALEYRVHGSSMSGNPLRMLADSVTVLKGERRHLRGRPELQRALRHHLNLVRGDYGKAALNRWLGAIRNGEYRTALRDLLPIMRHDPLGPFRQVARAGTRRILRRRGLAD